MSLTYPPPTTYLSMLSMPYEDAEPMPYEDAETRSARAETRVVTLEAFSIAVPLRNFELCPLYSEGRCGKNRKIYEIGHFSAARPRLGVVDTANCSKWTALYM